MTRVESVVTILIVCAKVEGQPVDLTQKDELDSLIGRIHACYDKNSRNIIVRLDCVGKVDEKTMFEIFSVCEKKQGLQVRFSGLQNDVLHTLVNSRMYNLFKIHPTTVEAFESF